MKPEMNCLQIVSLAFLQVRSIVSNGVVEDEDEEMFNVFRRLRRGQAVEEAQEDLFDVTGDRLKQE